MSGAIGERFGSVMPKALMLPAVTFCIAITSGSTARSIWLPIRSVDDLCADVL